MPSYLYKNVIKAIIIAVISPGKCKERQTVGLCHNCDFHLQILEACHNVVSDLINIEIGLLYTLIKK